MANDTITPTIDSLLMRGKLYLEDSDWKNANVYFERVLGIDPKYSHAYIGKLCVELKMKNEEALCTFPESISEKTNFKNAKRFADDEYLRTLEMYCSKNAEYVNKKFDKLRAMREYYSKYKNCIATGPWHTVALRTDGTVVATGENRDGSCKVNNWRNIVAISTGDCHTVGLKNDGTVVAVGENRNGQCNVSDLSDIYFVYVDEYSTVALGEHRTFVLGVGDVFINCCFNSNYKSSNWENDKEDFITMVIHESGEGTSHDGKRCYVTLFSNKIIVNGDNTDVIKDIMNWKDVVDIAGCFFGLTSKGKVLIAGSNTIGFKKKACDNITSWKNIVAIFYGYGHLFGIDYEGKIHAEGWEESEREVARNTVRSWTDIVAISVNTYHIVGLKSDGTLVTCTNCLSNGKTSFSPLTGAMISDGIIENTWGQCNVRTWDEIGPPSTEKIAQRMLEDKREREIEEERQREEEKRRHEEEQLRIEKEKQRKILEEQQRRKEEEKREKEREEYKKALSIEWAEKGLCSVCGGRYSFFTKKCKSCGHQK